MSNIQIHHQNSVACIDILGRGNTHRLNGPPNRCMAIRIPSFRGSNSVFSKHLRGATSILGSLLPTRYSGILITKLNGLSVATSTLNPGANSCILTAHRLNSDLGGRVNLRKLGDISCVNANILKRAKVRDTRVIGNITRVVGPSYVVTISTLTTSSTSHLNAALRFSKTNVIPNSNINGRQFRLSSTALNIPIVSMKVPAIVNTSLLSKQRRSGVFIAPHRVSTVVHHKTGLVNVYVGMYLRSHLSRHSVCTLLN